MWVTESPYSEYSAYAIHHFNCCELTHKCHTVVTYPCREAQNLGYPEMIIVLGTSLLNFNDFDPSTRCVCMATLVPDKWIRVGWQNTGSEGSTYFTCPKNWGLFMRQMQVILKDRTSQLSLERCSLKVGWRYWKYLPSEVLHGRHNLHPCKPCGASPNLTPSSPVQVLVIVSGVLYLQNGPRC